MASEAQKKASEKYDKNNTRNIMFKFNKKTDADILAQLDEVENRQGYIKQLIRNDLNKCAADPTPAPTIDKFIVSGKFEVGERVTVSIDGKEFTRVVRYSTLMKEPAITALNTNYIKSDFE